jgi:hypothetical protein
LAFLGFRPNDSPLGCSSSSSSNNKSGNQDRARE